MVSRRGFETLIIGLLLALIYLVYTGVYSFTEIVLALFTGFLIARILSFDLISNPRMLGFKRVLHGLAYVLKYFTVVEARAHYRVVKAILSLKPELKPSIVRVPYRVDSEYSIVSIANSITNTPGTVVVDIDEDRKYMYVHWLFTTSTRDEDAWREISREFEDWIKKIFEPG